MILMRSKKFFTKRKALCYVTHNIMPFFYGSTVHTKTLQHYYANNSIELTINYMCGIM